MAAFTTQSTSLNPKPGRFRVWVEGFWAFQGLGFRAKLGFSTLVGPATECHTPKGPEDPRISISISGFRI